MNKIRKHLVLITTVILLASSLSGCGLFRNYKKEYMAYVKGILDVNYKGEFDEYRKLTKASEEETQKVYDDGIAYFCTALMNYYGLQDIEGSDIKPQFTELAKNIYKKASYEVTGAEKSSGTYTVDITIYPIDILTITHDDVVAYIEDFNNRVDAGEFNEYDREQYEITYAQGIIDILNKALEQSGNLEEAKNITVTIINDGEVYYISDADFLALDNAIIDNSTSKFAVK